MLDQFTAYTLTPCNINLNSPATPLPSLSLSSPSSPPHLLTLQQPTPPLVPRLPLPPYLNNLLNLPLSETPPFRLPRSLYTLHASLKWSGCSAPSWPCSLCTSRALSTISPTKTFAKPEMTMAMFWGMLWERIWFDSYG
jgi:hypothetical protein